MLGAQVKRWRRQGGALGTECTFRGTMQIVEEKEAQGVWDRPWEDDASLAVCRSRGAIGDSGPSQTAAAAEQGPQAREVCFPRGSWLIRSSSVVLPRGSLLCRISRCLPWPSSRGPCAPAVLPPQSPALLPHARSPDSSLHLAFNSLWSRMFDCIHACWSLALLLLLLQF